MEMKSDWRTGRNQPGDQNKHAEGRGRRGERIGRGEIENRETERHLFCVRGRLQAERERERSERCGKISILN